MPMGLDGQVVGLSLSPPPDLVRLGFAPREFERLTFELAMRIIRARGRVLYAGKAKSLRTRLMSYFRARYPDDKQARILHAASDIAFDYTPSEFAAALAELKLIRKHRPPFNVAMNRSKRYGFLVLTDEPAPRLVATGTPERLRGRT